VLLAADGVPVKEIMTRVGVSKPTVIAWKKCYAPEGIGGLADRLKSRRPAPIDGVAVVSATLEPPPEQLGVTHRSSRLMAAQLGISQVWAGKICRRWGLRPWRSATFEFSTDPEQEAEVRDVVGLCVKPPENAVVLSVNEKSQVQVRPTPLLPMLPGIPERQTYGYLRHGITTLFAALEVATGKVIDASYPRHRHQEFLRFLKQVAKTHSLLEMRTVLDNYGTHKNFAVRAWQERNRRITLHSSPPAGFG
jgi:transposase